MGGNGPFFDWFMNDDGTPPPPPLFATWYKTVTKVSA